jgi:hypothetical protein
MHYVIQINQILILKYYDFMIIFNNIPCLLTPPPLYVVPSIPIFILKLCMHL